MWRLLSQHCSLTDFRGPCDGDDSILLAVRRLVGELGGAVNRVRRLWRGHLTMFNLEKCKHTLWWIVQTFLRR